MTKSDYFTVEELAKEVGLHPYTVRRLFREKKLPGFKFGGQWRFMKKDLVQLQKEARHGGKKTQR